MSTQTRLPDAGEHGVDLNDSTTETETTVRDVMLRHPKTLPVDASIRQAQAALDNDHVHLVLLTEGRRLAGTLTRTDLPPPGTLGPALAWSTLVGRTVSPDTPTTVVHGLLIDQGIRRLAVVDKDGSLLGLMCLKQRRTGFCSDADVAARSRSRGEMTSPSAGRGSARSVAWRPQDLVNDRHG
jgi:signal-transduction protein with cAMP-binding, CBS, and nucleotidyltransferase domain